MWKTSCVLLVSKNNTHEYPEQLQNSGSNIASDENTRETEKLVLGHLRSVIGPSMNPLKFASQPAMCVEDAAIFPLHCVLSHLGQHGGTLRIISF